MVIIQCAYLLDLLEDRILTASIILIYGNIILQLADHIGKPAAAAELDDPRCGLQFAEKQVEKLDLAGAVVKFVNLDLIGSQIHGAEILAVRGQVHTVHMGTEISFCHAAEALVKDLIRHLTDRAVLIQPHDRHLSIVPACYEEIAVILVRRQIAAAHALDARAI